MTCLPSVCAMPVSYITFGFRPVKSTMTVCARKIRPKMSWMTMLSSQIDRFAESQNALTQFVVDHEGDQSMPHNVGVDRPAVGLRHEAPALA